MNDARIFHIRSSYFYGGPERQITYLTKSLAGMDVESMVATFCPKDDLDKNKYYAKLLELGIPSYKIEIARSFDFSPLGRMASFIRDNEFNLLVGHDYRADFFVLKLAKALNLPAVSFSRGWTQNTIKVRFYEWLDLRFLKNMDGVVAVSPAKYDELIERGIDNDRLIYIPNSILVDKVVSRDNRIRDRFGIPDDAFVVGIAGRLSIEKNQEMLIKAAVRILSGDNVGDVRFLIAGEGPRHDELASMIPGELKDKIILAGWIENNDAFYADIDLFALTSRMEGFPNVLLEAGKYSLPAVSTPAGGATEIIEDGKTGFLIPFNDDHKLAERILAIYRDEELRKVIGEGLGRITREKFESGVNARLFIEFVDRVRGGHE